MAVTIDNFRYPWVIGRYSWLLGRNRKDLSKVFRLYFSFFRWKLEEYLLQTISYLTFEWILLIKKLTSVKPFIFKSFINLDCHFSWTGQGADPFLHVRQLKIIIIQFNFWFIERLIKNLQDLISNFIHSIVTFYCQFKLICIEDGVKSIYFYEHFVWAMKTFERRILPKSFFILFRQNLSWQYQPTYQFKRTLLTFVYFI